jgi:hypothetical protein
MNNPPISKAEVQRRVSTKNEELLTYNFVFDSNCPHENLIKARTWAATKTKGLWFFYRIKSNKIFGNSRYGQIRTVYNHIAYSFDNEQDYVLFKLLFSMYERNNS